MPKFTSTAYGWLILIAIGVSLLLWLRLAKRDSRLTFIYLAALAGAFIGAKLLYLFAEGWLYWHDDDRWIKWATGKSIIGGLLGGYGAVEFAKRLTGWKQPTGDWFAIIAPLGIMLGRVGCVVHGCCLGRIFPSSRFTVEDSVGAARWPAAHVEFLFNAAALAVILVLRRRRILRGQHFHLYLIAYGIFRFVHEFFRATPSIAGPLSGYQIAALVLLGFGIAAFLRRQTEARQLSKSSELDPAPVQS